jgi:biopolymer transport protein ExbB
MPSRKRRQYPTDETTIMHILFAQAAESEPVTRSLFQDLMDSGVMKYMIEGGIFMWPILVMAIIAVGVVIERFRSLRMLTIDASELRERVLELVQADRAEEALDLCNRSPGPVPAALAAGLRRYVMLRRIDADPSRIEEQTSKAMEDAGPHIAAVLEKNLPILGTISAIAPMVGSVGTVVGMVVLFQDIVAQYGAVNIVKAAAAGIQVKLLVTVWGLLVGIPAYVAYNYFTTVINRYLLHVEESATMLGEAVTVRLATLSRSSGVEQPSAQKVGR